MEKQYLGLFFGALMAFVLVSCETSPKKPAAKSKQGPEWESVAWESLQGVALESRLKSGVLKAIDSHLSHWKRKGRRRISLGASSFSASSYVKALTKVRVDIQRKKLDPAKAFAKYFDLLGMKSSSDRPMLLTGYYEPVMQASRKRNARFFQPLYEKPKNLVALDFRRYRKTFPEWDLWREGNYPRRVRGRLSRDQKVVPFYSREEIDEKGLLNNEADVIAYVEPIDAFFLQIQGSGVLQFPNGKMQTVGYSDQNGHEYYAIGRPLLGTVIPKEKMSMGAIREFLAGLEPEQAYEFMNLNPSYVFFQKLKSRGLTSLNTEVISEVTLASDPKVYPRGMFAFLQHWNQDGSKATRIVIHQDTGGAIKGALRADLFIGRGDKAEQVAGAMKNPARMMMLVPRTQ